MALNSVVEMVVERFMEILPKVGGAVIAIALGYIFGKLAGRAISALLDRTGIDKAVKDTSVGKALERSNITISSFTGALVRWFIYLVSLLVAADILEITVFSNFLTMLLEYIPYLIVGIFILVLGFMLSDFASNAALNTFKELGLIYSRLLSLIIRVFLYLVVVVMAFSAMRIDVTILYTFANALAWGLAAGLALVIGLAFGLGLKDAVAKNAENILRSLEVTVSKVGERVTMEQLESEIKRLRSELESYKAEKEREEKEREARLEALSKPVENLDEFLEKLIGSTGRVRPAYGGYEIEILNPVEFPWCDVLLTLQNLDFDIWFSKKDDVYKITCKPKT
ncbi:MAG: hypothetical protein AYL29_015330 [Candidatus Bathyarchaeota archaeon B24]|nr:MAG: hypothetical protein AYL29_015330 [Candidatus Bathyarchaeota archaeon B24]